MNNLYSLQEFLFSAHIKKTKHFIRLHVTYVWLLRECLMSELISPHVRRLRQNVSEIQYFAVREFQKLSENIQVNRPLRIPPGFGAMCVFMCRQTSGCLKWIEAVFTDYWIFLSMFLSFHTHLLICILQSTLYYDAHVHIQFLSLCLSGLIMGCQRLKGDQTKWQKIPKDLQCHIVSVHLCVCVCLCVSHVLVKIISHYRGFNWPLMIRPYLCARLKW